MARDGGNDGHTVADVGDEHAVHDIDMMPISLAVFNHGDIAAQMGEISSEKRRRNQMGHESKMLSSESFVRILWHGFIDSFHTFA